MRGENRHTQLVRPKGSLHFEEDKRTSVFPLFVVLTIHQTFAFLFALSSVHRVSVSCFFILYWICFLATLLVRIDKKSLVPPTVSDRIRCAPNYFVQKQVGLSAWLESSLPTLCEFAYIGIQYTGPAFRRYFVPVS